MKLFCKHNDKLKDAFHIICLKCRRVKIIKQPLDFTYAINDFYKHKIINNKKNDNQKF